VTRPKKLLLLSAVMVLVCLVSVIPVLLAQEGDEETAEEEKPPRVPISQIASYLDRMGEDGYKYRQVDENTLECRMIGENGVYVTRIRVSNKLDLVYLYIQDYLVVPKTHRNKDKMMSRLMELNFELNVGKFEWDSRDGEVRYSFTFSTENGLGFEAFRAVFETLLVTADDKYEDLQKLLHS